MKIRILLVIFCVAVLACSADAKARGARKSASHLSFGPVAAIEYSWTSDFGARVTVKPASALGFGVVYSRNEHWGFGAQLLVSQEGSRQVGVITSLIYPHGSPWLTDFTYSPLYMRIPLQALYFFGNYGDRFRPKAGVGPSLAVRVYETSKADRNDGGDDYSYDSEFYNRFDAGISALAGVNARISKRLWLNLDLTYYYGITDAITYAAYPGVNNNQNIRLGVGPMWGF